MMHYIWTALCHHYRCPGTKLGSGISNYHTDSLIMMSQELHHAIKITSQSMNLSPPSAAFMRQWTGSALIKITACRLFGKPTLRSIGPLEVNWTPRNKLQWNSNQNIFFYLRNAFENVAGETPAILCWGGWVVGVAVEGWIKQTMFHEDQEVGSPWISLLFAGSSFHDDNAVCRRVEPDSAWIHLIARVFGNFASFDPGFRQAPRVFTYAA